jgi:hypothetical protein
MMPIRGDAHTASPTIILGTLGNAVDLRKYSCSLRRATGYGRAPSAGRPSLAERGWIHFKPITSREVRISDCHLERRPGRLGETPISTRNAAGRRAAARASASGQQRHLLMAARGPPAITSACARAAGTGSESQRRGQPEWPGPGRTNTSTSRRAPPAMPGYPQPGRWMLLVLPLASTAAARAEVPTHGPGRFIPPGPLAIQKAGFTTSSTSKTQLS